MSYWVTVIRKRKASNIFFKKGGNKGLLADTSCVFYIIMPRKKHVILNGDKGKLVQVGTKENESERVVKEVMLSKSAAVIDN